jgi:hypothetical protein
MSRTITAGMQAKLDSTSSTLTTIITITRKDGVEYYLTEHDQNILHGGNTYLSSLGYDRTAIDYRDKLESQDLDITGFFDTNQITINDVRSGLLDFASVVVELIDYEDTVQTPINLRAGLIDEITINENGKYEAQIAGIVDLLSQEIGAVYQPTCRAQLGDQIGIWKCKFPLDPDERLDSTSYSLSDFVIVNTDNTVSGPTVLYESFEGRIYECTTAGTTAASPPVFDKTVGNTTTDGTVVWTARTSFAVGAVVATVTDNATITVTLADNSYTDDHFNFGVLVWQTGNNAGLGMEIKDWTSTGGTINLYMPMNLDINVGDQVILFTGCDKLLSTCRDKFVIPGSLDFDTGDGNKRDFKGEPFLPGRDFLQTYSTTP